MTNPSHIPDGLMCCGCIHALEKCNHLPFASMRVIETDKKDGTKVVKCTQYEKEPDES